MHKYRGFREKPWARVAFSFLQLSLRHPIKALWINRVEGLEHLPRDGAAIIAANHASYLDFFCLLAVSPRKIFFFAAEKFYRVPHWKLIMHSTSQIRCDREHSRHGQTWRLACSALEQGRIVGIFPEGTRSADGRIRPAKTGVAHLALSTGVPIIPAGISGTYDILPRHGSLPALGKSCTIRFGEPLRFSDQAGSAHSQEALQHITDQIMAKVSLLANPGVSRPS